MDEKLKTTIEKIKVLARHNKEFDEELRKVFGGQSASSAFVASVPSEIADDVKVIRKVLEISANPSVNYGFIQDQRLRDQLTVDNLRMENSALDLKKEERERFYNFCVNAFYQVENILNYYYHVTFPYINDLLTELEYYTKDEVKLVFVRRGQERSVADINVVFKIVAFCNKMFPHDTANYTLNSLRQVRNEGEHRCMVIQDQNDETNHLYKFFQLNTFNSIRMLLIKVVSTVQVGIGKPSVYVSNKVEAVITTMLPGACFVTFGGKTKQLPQNLLKQVKHNKEGDIIELSLLHGQIDGIG